MTGWVEALAALLAAWKATLDLAARRAEERKADERRLADAVKNLPPPPKEK